MIKLSEAILFFVLIFILFFLCRFFEAEKNSQQTERHDIKLIILLWIHWTNVGDSQQRCEAQSWIIN